METKLTPAMRRQLQVLATNRGNVNLGTVKALMDRGLVIDNTATRNNLRMHNRMPGSYRLTPAGQTAAQELDDA